MSVEHTFHCGITPSKVTRRRVHQHELSLWGPGTNITLELDDLTNAISRRLPPRSRDLIEIAAYVSAADQSVPRGGDSGHDVGRGWRRRFAFRIAVRDLAFWTKPKVKSALADALGFVSDDSYDFDFASLRSPPTDTSFLDLGRTPAQQFRASRVLAFSGGLDSFAGAVECLFSAKEQVALVTHRASTKLDPLQRALAQQLRTELLRRGNTNTAHHFSIGLSKAGELDRERTQRTRSFFFAAIGGVVARELEADSLFFFENGVVSMNLPIAAQVVGTRATRTTHPKTLLFYERLLSDVFETTFRVENPFIWKTKADVVRIAVKNGCGPMIASTISCGNVIGMTKDVKHCGRCSQCIDRRFGILAADAAEFEARDAYAVDLFLAPRTEPVERTQVEAYVRHGREVLQMDPRAFLARSGEAARVYGALPGTKDEAAARVLDLVQRHATEVKSVLDRELVEAVPAMSAGTLDASSLLGMVIGKLPAKERVATPKKRSLSSGRSARTIRVLHISDTHFAPTHWGQAHLLVKLADDVRRQREELGRTPDLIIWTGDIADRGAADEYSRAEEWLRESLLPAADLNPDRVILVPGNHDVNRSKITETVKALHERMLGEKDHEVIAAILGDERQRAPLFASHENFIAFARRIEPGRAQSTTPWQRTLLTINGHDVHIASLCSSLVAYDSARDETRLVVGRFQAHEVLPAARNAALVLTGIHHPWNYLVEFDRDRVAEEVRRRSHVVLRGHLHESSGAVYAQPHASTIELAAGATYATTEYPNSYQLLEWAPATQRLRVHIREWDRHDWIAHRNAFAGQAPHGYVDFRLPAEKKSSPRGRRK